MNSRQLVSSALRGLPVPRTPSGPLAVHFCAACAGHTLRRYTTDPAALADSVVSTFERFRPDAIWLSSDTWVRPTCAVLGDSGAQAVSNATVALQASKTMDGERTTEKGIERIQKAAAAKALPSPAS